MPFGAKLSRCSVLYSIEKEYYMKRLNLVAMILALGVSAVCVSCVITIIPIAGNGNIIDSERDVAPFEKIRSSGSAKVRFHESQEYRAVVSTDSNLDEYVVTTVNNRTLTIRTKTGHFSFTKLVVDVYCPVVTNVSISGSGSFSGDTITTPSFGVDISGSGSVNGTVECTSFSANISGSGKITVAGNSANTNIAISGSGKYDGDQLNSNNVNINISGSGNAAVYVTNNLSATISGSGAVYYRGSPASTNLKVSGSGRIWKR